MCMCLGITREMCEFAQMLPFVYEKLPWFVRFSLQEEALGMCLSSYGSLIDLDGRRMLTTWSAGRGMLCVRHVGVSFRSKRMAMQAFTLKAFTSTTLLNNERLEFLGDAVLDYVVRRYSHYLSSAVSPQPLVTGGNGGAVDDAATVFGDGSHNLARAAE